MLFLNGIPFFFMELAIGQWFSAGVIGVWKSVCPLMKGKRDSRSYKKRRPRAVVILSSKPRAAGEKVKLCKLEVKNEERLSGEIENTSWKVLAYGIYARVVDVSEIERVSAANE